MRILSSLISFVFVVISATVSAQTPAASNSSDGLELLKRVSQHYADAKSYHIQAQQEYESHNELERNWQKMLLEAAEAPDGKLHYQGRGGMGAALRISDGKQVWSYHVDEHAYTTTSVVAKDPNERRIIPHNEMALMTAENLRGELANFAKRLKSATRLPDAELDVSGRQTSCYVVRVNSDDNKRHQPDYSFEQTIWIEKATETVVKLSNRAHNYMLAGGGMKIPIETETTTTYSIAEYDRPVADSLFSFTPPAEAKLVDHFADPMNLGPSLEGQPFPQLKLTTVDGKAISMESLRGKPVLVDVWATWCAPCIKGLEKVASIYKDAKDKGLMLITIDLDEDAETASAFLAKKGYSWPNIHDDGKVGQALDLTGGIPRPILIDSTGKVVYDRHNDDDDKLRAAIANLGPQFASLVRKQQLPPCGTQMSAVSQ